MKANRKKEIWKGLTIFFMVLLLWGCHVIPIGGVKAGEKPRLVIFPFFIEKGENPGRGAFCPVCNRVFQWSDVPLGSENILTRLLYQKLETKQIFKVIPLEKVEEAMNDAQEKGLREKPITTFLKLGRRLGGDFVMVGVLFRFDERIGSAVGVEKPASVGFDLHLFRLRDEKMVWEGRFDETQQPLSENLLKVVSFFRRGAFWLTAEKLASAGMGERLKKLPSAKELVEMP